MNDKKFCWVIYAIKDKMLIPNTGRVKVYGYRTLLPPVRVVDNRDKSAIEKAINEAIQAGNVQFDSYDDVGDADELKAFLALAGVKSWSTFEKKAIYFSIGFFDGVYQVCTKERLSNGRWNQTSIVLASELPGDTPISKITEIILEHIKQRTDLN